MAIQATLNELQKLLYGLNYEVFLHIYQLPFVSGIAAQDYIKQALPNSEIGGTQPTSSQELLTEVEQSLRYTGHIGSGPKPRLLNSPKFEELLTVVLSHLERVTSGSTEAICFWLKSGHPADPVFWDFAFVVVKTQNVEIFIGSSSD